MRFRPKDYLVVLDDGREYLVRDIFLDEFKRENRNIKLIELIRSDMRLRNNLADFILERGLKNGGN
jgi:hypothetical protein